MSVCHPREKNPFPNADCEQSHATGGWNRLCESEPPRVAVLQPSAPFPARRPAPDGAAHKVPLPQLQLLRSFWPNTGGRRFPDGARSLLPAQSQALLRALLHPSARASAGGGALPSPAPPQTHRRAALSAGAPGAPGRAGRLRPAAPSAPRGGPRPPAASTAGRTLTRLT